jgi:hypothetical protein
MYQENSAWVDQRLEELYHGYGLTAENCDDYIEAGLLIERWDWVDNKLQNQYNAEFEDMPPCLAPLSWVLYKNYESQYCLEEEEETMSQRSRAESDISDYSAEVERAIRRIDLPQGMYPVNYIYLYALADEVSSLDGVSSLEEDFEDCSPISHYSEITSLDYDFGYDSF